MRALGDRVLSPHARIVIAGSAGARGTMPGMSVHLASFGDKEAHRAYRYPNLARILQRHPRPGGKLRCDGQADGSRFRGHRREQSVRLSCREAPLPLRKSPLERGLRDWLG